MIQLEFMKKDKDTRDKVVKKYYDELAKKSKSIHKLDEWCDNNLDMDKLISKKYDTNLKVKSFEKVVTADLKTLLNIKKYVDLNNLIMNESLKNYTLKTGPLSRKRID